MGGEGDGAHGLVGVFLAGNAIVLDGDVRHGPIGHVVEVVRVRPPCSSNSRLRTNSRVTRAWGPAVSGSNPASSLRHIISHATLTRVRICGILRSIVGWVEAQVGVVWRPPCLCKVVTRRAGSRRVQKVLLRGVIPILHGIIMLRVVRVVSAARSSALGGGFPPALATRSRGTFNHRSTAAVSSASRCPASFSALTSFICSMNDAGAALLITSALSSIVVAMVWRASITASIVSCDILTAPPETRPPPPPPPSPPPSALPRSRRVPPRGRVGRHAWTAE